MTAEVALSNGTSYMTARSEPGKISRYDQHMKERNVAIKAGEVASETVGILQTDRVPLN